jgi:2-succinyl-5-enolpyruvyl-6-hydroxy-3-cyclohexene-1-carboxylate synthase
LAAQPTLASNTWHELLTAWDRSEKTLIAVGQMPYDPAMLTILKKFSEELGVPIVGEITGNIPVNDIFITRTDTLLSGLTEGRANQLRPDLLITIGNSFLTRNLKTFFRQYPAPQHWHVQPTVDRINDSFQSLTTLIPADPLAFLEKLFADLDYQRFLQGDDEDETAGYLSNWQRADRQAAKLIEQTVGISTSDPTQPLTDWSTVQIVLEQVPQGSVLQVANSMPVRYANLCGVHERQQISVWGNRGVSGIDGCLSTAVGAALMTDQIVTLLIGDVAFFYDRNALWSAPIPPNLRIVLLNNDSGHIFRIIDGPSRQPELETYFETPHGYTAKRTAEDAGITYYACESIKSLRSLLPDFMKPGHQAKLLELTTDKFANQQQFAQYKEQVRLELGNQL